MHSDEGTREGALSRRDLLRLGLSGAAGALAGERLLAPAAAGTPPAKVAAEAKAKAVIQVWLWGGPCHLDTFDPKPEAGAEYCGPFDQPLSTSVPGMRLCQLLPQLAKQADKLVLVRSTTHGNNGHETAAYMVQTGWRSGGRDVYPGAGAVASRFLGYDAGYQGLIPPYVVLTRPQGRFSEAGFLGGRYKPFATGGDPGKKEFLVEGVAAPGLSRRRQESRRELLGRLDSLRRARGAHPLLGEMLQSEEQAYDLILGDAGRVFDLEQEGAAVRDRYGRSTFGQSCLAARRLVERGVRYVTINFGGWDTHKEHFQAMRRKLPELDLGLASLIQDLAARGLLESTILWVGGEFGRTPRIQSEAPWNGGRHHFGSVFSTLLAGGGFRGGSVVGASDAKGMQVAERPVYPWDLIGSVYAQLGIPADARLRHPMGQELPLLPGPQDGYPSGGLLREVM